ncbi:Acetylglutamate kinase [Bythopirellula polymerisocia]|uniref:Acetylglutamate kinase n=1 Tax=Bythopirellula polymerisocia TaxID=2528003 RepID=A0A5C6CVC5_9BACT|nr:Acetylglutamate kinase [Bythopirellula polymerisocia]
MSGGGDSRQLESMDRLEACPVELSCHECASVARVRGNPPGLPLSGSFVRRTQALKCRILPHVQTYAVWQQPREYPVNTVLNPPLQKRSKPRKIVLQDAIQKADVLIEAMGWIRQFRDKITVIKLGGSVMEDPDALRHLLVDIVFMETVGMKPIVVHGGGAAISRAMAEAKIEPRFIHGRRYTDEATLAIVERVLAGEINESLAESIEEFGGRAMPLNFSGQNNNVLFGERLEILDEEGKPIDLGYVGTVTQVDRETLDNLTYAGQVPVIPSMCETASGERLNVNADTAATAVAQAVGAEKLIFLSDVNGVRRDKEDPDSLIHTLSADEAQELIADGRIESGMIPKVQACLETLTKGVGKIHIIDGRLRHSLLLEIYTNRGVGTEIIAEPI